MLDPKRKQNVFAMEPLETRRLMSAAPISVPPASIMMEYGTLHNKGDRAIYSVTLLHPGWLDCVVKGDVDNSMTLQLTGSAGSYSSTDAPPYILFDGGYTQQPSNLMPAGNYTVTVIRSDSPTGHPEINFTLGMMADYAGRYPSTSRDDGGALSGSKTYTDWLGSYDSMQDSMDVYTVHMSRSGVINASVSYPGYTGEYLNIGSINNGNVVGLAHTAVTASNIETTSATVPAGNYAVTVGEFSAVNFSTQPYTLTIQNQPLVPKYVMASIASIDELATIHIGSSAASWTYSPAHWRYGFWGGVNWSDGLENPSAYDKDGPVLDSMDALFRNHDNAYASAGDNQALITQADETLLAGLKSLPLNSNGEYVSGAPGVPSTIIGTTLIGTSIPIGTPVVFSEYARQQAINAFTLKITYERIGSIFYEPW